MPETCYEDRTDSIETKLRLLQQACATGKHELTMSLLESMKDTVTLERQNSTSPQSPDISAEAYFQIPSAWASWAHGWHFCKVLEVSEEAGISRCQEPVDVQIVFADDQSTDLRRDIRLVLLDKDTGTLREVASQICSQVFTEGQRHCRIVFQADVPAHGRVHYLIFYGNPYAELPQYATDLQIAGEGYALDVENKYYAAHLSRQMGQMESLRYKRTHGLTLSADAYYDGVGHGEPANIDWAHDYFASNCFQKFRVTNWAQCPNYEVIKGPLCVQVRRWGFPHGPVHPLFAPSRMHIDVQYTFYAGLPYFIKQSRMEMIQDFEMNCLRDDEWVIAGHPFTQTVWMDRSGVLHEGKVKKEHENDLWGVGFIHDRSRECFIALFLEHSAENYDGISHSGLPSMNGVGPGVRTIWSRAAVHNDPHFKEGAVLKQRNAYLLQPYEGSEQVQEIRKRMLAPLKVRSGELPNQIPVTAGQLARRGETEETAPLKRAIWEALREVCDQQYEKADANVVDMGYVYDLHVEGDLVSILITMPHRGRPKYGFIGEPLRKRLLDVNGVREVVVNFTWEPAWDIARLTARGREIMGLNG